MCTSHAGLVRAVTAGDPHAIAQLLRLVSCAVAQHAAIHRVVVDRMDVEDLVQDCCLRVLDRLPSLRDPERLGCWLGAVAHNAVVSWIRARACVRHGQELLALTLAGQVDSQSDQGGPGARVALQAALRRLPPLEKQAVELRYLEDCPRRRLARLLHVVPDNTMKGRLRRGLQALRRELDADRTSVLAACLANS